MESVLLTSCITTAMRSRGGHDGAVFRSADHSATMSSVKLELKGRAKARHDSTLDSIVSKLPYDTRRTILRGKESGAWLSVPPAEVNGTVLRAQEWRDSLQLRYARSPGDLQPLCDGCGQKNTEADRSKQSVSHKNSRSFEEEATKRVTENKDHCKYGPPHKGAHQSTPFSVALLLEAAESWGQLF
jgi:hypothetical protein